MGQLLSAIHGVRYLYGLYSTHVSDLPRLFGGRIPLRLIRHIFQPPCPAEFKVCTSKWCSTALPLLYSFDSMTKSVIAVNVLLVIISSIGEMNGRHILLTAPALCYAIGLSISICIKISFNSSSYVRLYEHLILLGNALLCSILFIHAFIFDQQPTKEDRTLKFTRFFTVRLCIFQFANTAGALVSLAIERAHYSRKHSPAKNLRDRRFAELHRTFRDLRTARYGGLTSVPNSGSLGDVGDGCAYFPKDKLQAGKSLIRPIVEKDEVKLFPQFLRCSCCVDSLPSFHAFVEHDSEQNSSSTLPYLKSRSDARLEFLTRPGWQHLLQEYSPEIFNSHSLCSLCQNICCSSSIIQSRESFNPSRHFGLFIRERESFDHYGTPQELFDSVEDGCHLCTLIWTSMSPGQRISLLAADETLGVERERSLAAAPGAKERRAIENTYDRHRRIRLLVETFDGDIPPIDSQIRSSHSLEIGKGAAQIVPHFGRFKRPRRWMSGIRNFENQMLVEQGESEFAPPILILLCDQNENGPIKLPVSDSTGSAFSISLIKGWLHETEPTEHTSFLPGRVVHVGSALKHGIIRVLEKNETLSRSLRSRDSGHPSSLANECQHKFSMGCINKIGLQCCACMAGEWSFSESLLNDQMRNPSYCPRCEEYRTQGSFEEYHAFPIKFSDSIKSTQYIALSHCWGENPDFLKLTLKNQHKLRLGISLGQLTKTFREAVITSASAGYNFLWIDSLCIIQDSAEDWKRESMKMSDIYKNAAFTIVASAAWNGHEGLFRTQDPLPNHPCVLGVRSRQGRTTITYAIPTQMDIEKTRRVELELSKWNRRGWCLQERALSRRILYFGESQLHFELKNESGEVIRLESQTNERAYFQANRLRPGSSIARVYSALMWWEYVNSYTQRQLTYRKDRPVAIQGLAVSMEEAGIPMFLPALRSEIELRGSASNDFVASLLWYVDRDRTGRPSTQIENYPTWSWLSVDGVVFNDSAGEVHSNSTLSILEFVESDLLGNEENTTIFAAGIKGLQLKASGKLKSATWKAVPDTFYFACRGGIDALCFSPPGYRDEELLFTRELQKNSRSDPRWWPRSEGKFEYLEMIKPVSNDAGMGPQAHILQTQEGVSMGWIVPDTTDPLPSEIYCLEIRVEPVTAAEKHKLINTMVVRGLILDRVRDRSDTQLPEYKRIGFFELDAKHRGFLHPDLAFDWKFPPDEREGLRSNFLREWPDVDPNGFFEGVDEQFFMLS